MRVVFTNVDLLRIEASKVVIQVEHAGGKVPWADKNSRFTSMFEAFAIAVLEAARSLEAGRRLLGLSWDSANKHHQTGGNEAAEHPLLAPLSPTSRVIFTLTTVSTLATANSGASALDVLRFGSEILNDQNHNMEWHF